MDGIHSYLRHKNFKNMATKFKNLSFDLQIRRTININNYLMEVDPMVIFASDSKFVEGEEVEDMIF